MFDPKEKNKVLSLILETNDRVYYIQRAKELFGHMQMAYEQDNWTEVDRILTGLIQVLVATKASMAE